jgi:hypothetical protein
MTDSNHVFPEFDLYRTIQKALNAKNKAAVFDALARAGITRVTVSFDGEGDSGCIEEISAYRGEEPCKLPALLVTLLEAGWDNAIPTQESLRKAVETLCYDFLSQEHGGWEDNEGASGLFEFDVSERSIELEINTRFVETLTSNHTF